MGVRRPFAALNDGRRTLELGPLDQEDDVFSAFGGFSLTMKRCEALMTDMIVGGSGVARRLVNEAGSL